MSMSSEDNNLKVWTITTWDCIVNIPHVNTSGIIYSACFYYSNNENYIVTSNFSVNEEAECAKVFDFEGKLIKNIKGSEEHT